MNEVGFFSALRGTCSGTRIFSCLRRNSWDRTILHLFLMSLLCAGFITVGQGVRFFQEIGRLNAAFGGICLNGNGLVPKLDPGQARTFVFADSARGRVFYLPAIPAQGVAIPEQELMLTDFGVLWTPKLLVLLFRLPENRWQCSEIPVGMTAIFPSTGSILPSTELPRYLAGLRQPAREIMQQSEQVVPIAAGIVGAGMFLYNLLTVFLLPLVYTSFFMLVFRLSGGGRVRVLSLGEFWRVGIYAGFPAMLFAACFPAFDLPFFRYGMVYMIGLVVYWLIVAGRIEQAGAEGGNSDE